jgi:hypothetical protein
MHAKRLRLAPVPARNAGRTTFLNRVGSKRYSASSFRAGENSHKKKDVIFFLNIGFIKSPEGSQCEPQQKAFFPTLSFISQLLPQSEKNQEKIDKARANLTPTTGGLIGCFKAFHSVPNTEQDCVYKWIKPIFFP